MKQYTLKEAAQVLGINHETLRAKMQRAAIDPVADTIDKRRKFLSQAQLTQIQSILKAQHKPTSSNNDVNDLLEQIRQLEERVTALEASVSYTPVAPYEANLAVYPRHMYQRSETRHETLPDGLTSLVEIAKEYGIPETTIKSAAKDGRVPCTLGTWKIGRQFVRYAVTDEQKKAILAYFRPEIEA